MLKYAKSKIVNDTNKKFNRINYIFHEAKKYVTNKRRIEDSSSSNKNSNSNNDNNDNNNDNNNNDNDNNDNNNNDNDNNDEDNFDEKLYMETEYNLMLGKLSFELGYCLEKDFGELIDIPPIPIIGLLALVLEPELNFGFCFSIGLEAKIHKQILDKEKFKYIVGEEEDDDDDNNDTKLTLKILGKGEV